MSSPARGNEPPTDPADFARPATRWVREQLEAIDAAGGDTRVAQVQHRPIVLVLMRGARTGQWRRVPLMRVEHDGTYAAVASKGGSPSHPEWFHNLVAHPEVHVHDGTRISPATARVATGAEREAWWERAVGAFPPYAEYQDKTERQIPLFLLEP